MSTLPRRAVRVCLLVVSAIFAATCGSPQLTAEIQVASLADDEVLVNLYSDSGGFDAWFNVSPEAIAVIDDYPVSEGDPHLTVVDLPGCLPVSPEPRTFIPVGAGVTSSGVIIEADFEVMIEVSHQLPPRPRVPATIMANPCGGE